MKIVRQHRDVADGRVGGADVLARTPRGGHIKALRKLMKPHLLYGSLMAPWADRLRTKLLVAGTLEV